MRVSVLVDAGGCLLEIDNFLCTVTYLGYTNAVVPTGLSPKIPSSFLPIQQTPLPPSPSSQVIFIYISIQVLQCWHWQLNWGQWALSVALACFAPILPFCSNVSEGVI